MRRLAPLTAVTTATAMNRILDDEEMFWRAGKKYINQEPAAVTFSPDADTCDRYFDAQNSYFS